jgi:hypothetical protein
MIKYFLLFSGLLLSMQVIAQTGIGTTTPDPSAKLHVASDRLGFLPPQVTLTSTTDNTTIRNAAGTAITPAVGLLVYNVGSVGLKAGYYYWNGSNWATIATASSPDQTVDYVSVQSSGQTVVTGNTIRFNTTLSGNIPYNSSTGNFTLNAGKTYRLTAYATLDVSSSAGAELNFVWRNADNTEIGNYALLLAANSTINAAGQGIVDVIYTPTTNTTVSVYVNWAGGTVALRGGYTYATIQQVGSSATVNPWILSGTNTYNTTGNLGIGTSTPNSSAILDISSTTKGITFPRMTTEQRNAISSPTTGLQVFDNTTNSIWYFDGSTWVNSVSVASFGDVKTGFQSADHNGWVKLDGRLKSSLTSAQRTQATALSIGDNLPDASNAVLMQSSGTLGTVAGSMSMTLAQNQLPNIAPLITVDNTIATMQNAGSHQHSISVVSSSIGGYAAGNPNAFKKDMAPTTESNADLTDRGGGTLVNTGIIGSAGDHNHTINTHGHSATSTSINGGVTQQTIDITPRRLVVNTFIYLGY